MTIQGNYWISVGTNSTYFYKRLSTRLFPFFTKVSKIRQYSINLLSNFIEKMKLVSDLLDYVN